MSASNKAWEIAIAVPLKNPFFRYPCRVSMTGGVVSSTTASNITNISTETFTVGTTGKVPNLSFLLKSGDRVFFKDSSGNTDSSVITSVGASSLVYSPAISVTGTSIAMHAYGTRFPQGWDSICLDSYNGDPIAGFSNTTINIVKGDFDNYAFYLNNEGTTTELWKGIYQQIDDYFKPSTTYRMGVSYKRSDLPKDDDSPIFNCGFYFKNGSSIQQNLSIPEASSWTITTTTSSSASSNSGDNSFAFGVYTNVKQSSNQIDESPVMSLYVDSIFLEHSYSSAISDEISNTSNGYYEFPDFADLGSVSYEVLQSSTDNELQLMNKSVKWYDSSGWGQRNEKYRLKARFSNISQTFYETLLSFIREQEDGAYINLHTYIDDLPTVLTGRIKLSNITKDIWDLSKRSLNFEFIEM